MVPFLDILDQDQSDCSRVHSGPAGGDIGLGLQGEIQQEERVGGRCRPPHGGAELRRALTGSERFCSLLQLKSKSGVDFLIQYDTESIISDWYKVLSDTIRQLVRPSADLHLTFLSAGALMT